MNLINSKRYILAVDPGTHGAYSLINSDGEIVKTYPLELIETEVPNTRKGSKKKTRIERTYNIRNLFDDMTSIKEEYNPLVFIEKVSGRPTDGGVNGFKFGKNYGEIRGVFVSAGMKFIKIPPATWCKKMHIGVFGGKPKDRSHKAFLNMYGHYRGMPSTKIKREGVIDATLIAKYGQLMIEQGIFKEEDFTFN